MAQASVQDSKRPSTRTREPATSGRLRGGALAAPEASEYEKMTRETVILGEKLSALYNTVAHLTCPPKRNTVRQTR